MEIDNNSSQLFQPNKTKRVKITQNISKGILMYYY